MMATKKPTRPDVKVFIEQYKLDRNGRRAAIAAGYSPHSADQTASRLLRSAKVRAEVEQHRADSIAKVQEETGITLARTLKEIARIAFFDPRRLFREDGEPLGITDLDDDTAAVIAGLESATERKRGSNKDAGETYIRKYKLADKKGGLDMLMKHLGGYEVDNKQKGDALADLIASVQGTALKPKA